MNAGNVFKKIGATLISLSLMTFGIFCMALMIMLTIVDCPGLNVYMKMFVFLVGAIITTIGWTGYLRLTDIQKRGSEK